MHLHVPLQLAMEQGMNMLLSCGLLVYVYALHRVFSLKESSSTLLSLPFTDCKPLISTGGCALQAGASPPPCFFSAVFSEWQIAALCFLFV